jgi:Holliday junction resolvase RusA-like endonuclease
MGQRKECPRCTNTPLYFLAAREFTPADQKEYERFAALCAQQGMRGREKFTGPTVVECWFWFGIPRSRMKTLKEGDYHTQRPDVDNCKKSILDACNLLVWGDDCIIVDIIGRKRWTTGVPRTEVTISEAI